MADIVIRGMEMPEYCYECPCHNEEHGCCQAYKGGYLYSIERPASGTGGMTMADLIRRSEAQELLACYTEKNNLGHTPYQIVSNLPSAGPKWISVEERLPGDKALVLCKCRAGIYEVLSWIGASWYHDTNHCYMKGFVTHWMPLPDPPKEGGGEDG